MPLEHVTPDQAPAGAPPSVHVAPRAIPALPAARSVSRARIQPRALTVTVVTPVYNERHLLAESLRRVLQLEHELIAGLQVIVVDDGCTDGSGDVLRAIAASDPRVTLVHHDRNRGKGAALRTALARATGEVTLIHDADLEYDPADIPALLVPFVTEGADAVFGSRYLAAPYRRALRHRHTMVNRALTALGNWLTDLSLTDLETGYKAVRTTLLRSIPLRSDDFRIEVELAFKLAKRRSSVFEVPIRYLPRSEREGKKIRARDGLRALGAMMRFALVDDLYQDDEYGSRILVEMEKARRFNLWMGDTLRPFVGERVLEIGAGIGTLTSQFIPRELYVASDINPSYLDYLSSYAMGKPYLHALEVDAAEPEHFRGLEGIFDTVLMINVLEHVSRPDVALANIHRALAPGGRAVILVPQHPELYGTLDEALEHRERYTPQTLVDSLTAAGFQVQRLFDFNRFSRPGWWLNGRVLRRRTFSRVQLKALDTLLPLLRRIDRALPWSGLSVIAVATKGPLRSPPASDGATRTGR
ncbi:MAG: glycosyltransferase [Gemmatimonadaceae bacterium]|nr:glycosyltransferase [Gemmatimonadaceae bacterium]